MATMREIKRRKASIQSTGQITKAMKLISTIKLQKARAKAEATKPYTDQMYATMTSILAKSGTVDHRYMRPSTSPKKAVIVVTSNRGLAGGYNSNIIKMVMDSGIAKEDALLVTIGNKGKDGLSRKGYSIYKDYSDVITAPMYSDAAEIGKLVLDMFENGEIGEIYLAYTSFKNTVVHIPKFIKLLPVEVKEEDTTPDKANVMMNYEPDEISALDAIIPKYMNSILYGALMESVASENGARMQAMDAATSNAEEMIADLSLQYNRARQGAITQELTEIIAGASAIE